MSVPSDKKDDPLRLAGLRQATYVMKKLDEGKDLNDIIEDFESDQQLVKMWMSFLQHNQWIEKPDGKWLITDKGREKMAKYDSSP